MEIEYNNERIKMFKKEEKIKLKEILNNLKENLKKQNEGYYNLFLKPNDNMIKAIDRFLLNSPYNISKRHEQIGIKELKHILNKAGEYKQKVRKIIKFTK